MTKLQKALLYFLVFDYFFRLFMLGPEQIAHNIKAWLQWI